MNDLDEQLRAAFAARAEATTVKYRADFGSPVTVAAPSRPWRPIIPVAAVTVAIMVLGLALLSRSVDDKPPATAPTVVDTTTNPVELGINPLLPEVFPALPADDPRQPSATAAYSGFVGFEAAQAGRAVIGRIESGQLVDPVSVSVYADADEIPFTSSGDQVAIDGTTYERHVVGGNPVQRTLVRRGGTDAVITGSDPESFVAAAQGIPVADVTLTAGGGLTFSLTPLPDGYVTIVEPATFPTLSPVADLTFGSEVDDSFGNVTTGRLSGLLLDATTSSFRQVDVDGTPGWASQPAAGAVGTVIWQVAPATWATAIGPTPTAALDLARSVIFVDEATWQATYNVARPDDPRLNAPATPSATFPASNPPSSPTPDPTPLEAWAASEVAAGRTLAQVIDGVGTTARGIASWNDARSEFGAAVILDDGRVIDLNPPDTAATYGRLPVYGLGRSIAIPTNDDGRQGLRLLDPETGTWSDGPDLGLNPRSGSGSTRILAVEGSLLIGRSSWIEKGDTLTVPGPDRDGVVVTPALRVTPVAPPPAGIQMEWTSVSGTFALNFGIEPGASSYEPFTQPWAYDTGTNTWSPIPIPDWLTCDGDVDCQWYTPHEPGDEYLEVTTPAGIVKRIPDGTVGMYDPTTATWKRLDDAPFTLGSPEVALVNDDQLVVAPLGSSDTLDEFGQIGVLDLTEGSWSTTRLPTSTDQYAWDLRTDNRGVLVAPVIPGEQIESPALAFDNETQAWRATNGTDQDRWTALPSTYAAGESDLTQIAQP